MTAKEYRRPYGCAVLPLSANRGKLSERDWDPSDNLKIYTMKRVELMETHFNEIPEMVADGRFGELDQVPHSKGIALSLRMFEGVDEETLFASNVFNDALHTNRGERISTTPKNRFNEAMDPGCERNDLFITLMDGEFMQDGKRSAKNIEVRMHALMDDGTPVKCLLRGNGPQNQKASWYRSVSFWVVGRG